MLTKLDTMNTREIKAKNIMVDETVLNNDKQ